jgi:glyoxylase-like metal-dependent hydrolase (beta-lactamase superfamily II)
MKKVLKIAGIAVTLILVLGALFTWIGYRKYMNVEIVRVDPWLKVAYGGGGNSVILTSVDGSKALVIDTKMGDAAKKLREAVTAGEVTIINTHAHRDHTGGNELYLKASIIAGAYLKELWEIESNKQRYPDETVAIGDEKIIRIDSETVHVRNMGVAHTTNDLVVYFEKRKLLVTGDLVFAASHPVLFAKSGCNVDAWVVVLDRLKNNFAVTSLLPGHGRMGNASQVTVMSDYFTSIRDAIGNKEKLEELKKQYKDWHSIPAMSGFDKTVEFIESQKK